MHTRSRDELNLIFTLGDCHFLIQLFSRIFNLAHIVSRFHFQRVAVASVTEKIRNNFYIETLKGQMKRRKERNFFNKIQLFFYYKFVKKNNFGSNS